MLELNLQVLMGLLGGFMDTIDFEGTEAIIDLQFDVIEVPLG